MTIGYIYKMEIIRHIINMNRMDAEYLLLPLGDIHWGNVELNIIKIIKFRKMLQNTLGEKEQVLKRNAIKREGNYKIK